MVIDIEMPLRKKTALVKYLLILFTQSNENVFSSTFTPDDGHPHMMKSIYMPSAYHFLYNGNDYDVNEAGDRNDLVENIARQLKTAKQTGDVPLKPGRHG